MIFSSVTRSSPANEGPDTEAEDYDYAGSDNEDEDDTDCIKIVWQIKFLGSKFWSISVTKSSVGSMHGCGCVGLVGNSCTTVLQND